MSLARPLGRRAAIVSALALAGCNTVLSRPAYVQRTTWPLELAPPRSLGVHAPKKPSKTLIVEDFNAVPGLDQQGVQWLNQDGSVHADFYNVWQVQPAAAVSDDVMRWLSASHLFAAVVGSGSALTADLMLDGQLTAFVADPARLRAHAALSITLVNPRTIPAKVLMQRTFSADAPMPKATPEGVVAGQRAALANVLNQLTAALRHYA
jgi:ABC-type uncharacterized transport system auxiliary subunit